MHPNFAIPVSYNVLQNCLPYTCMHAHALYICPIWWRADVGHLQRAQQWRRARRRGAAHLHDYGLPLP